MVRRRSTISAVALPLSTTRNTSARCIAAAACAVTWSGSPAPMPITSTDVVAAPTAPSCATVPTRRHWPPSAPLHQHEAMDELTRLARAAGAGDRYALASFVRLSDDEVHRLCAALVDRGSADDLTQDTYLRAIPALARF